MPRLRLVQDCSIGSTPLKTKDSSLACAAIPTRQAERPAHGIEKTVPFYFRASTIHPVFFRRRKRKSKQVGRSRNQTATHPQSKCGTLEEASRRRIDRGQPLPDLLHALI